MIYHRASLSFDLLGLIRTPSYGVGNLLLPISRSLIGAKEKGHFVYPTFPQLKIGTFIRNEPDKRIYLNLFRGRTPSEWGKYFRSYAVKQIAEEKFDLNNNNDDVSSCIVYKGMKNYFHDIFNEKNYIKNWITDSYKKKKIRFDFQKNLISKISVHVRLGDFSINKTGSNETTYQIPKKWYLESIEYISKKHNITNDDVTVYSDTTTLFIRDWLGNKNYKYIGADIQSPIESMLLASRSNYFIGSRSTFSMWIAFFSDGICYWDSGFKLNKFFPERFENDFKV